MARSSLIVLLALSLGAVVLAGVDPVTRRDAARLQAKIDKISKSPGGRSGASVRTPVSETEVNSYVRYELNDRIPPGVKDPWVSILGAQRLTGRAVVDLTQVAQSRKSGNLMDPWNLVGGSLPVEVNGLLHTKAGIGTFAVESVSISGVPVPAWMLQEIVNYYSKAAVPEGVSLDKPFPLPAGIREIELERGQAVVVQ